MRRARIALAVCGVALELLLNKTPTVRRILVALNSAEAVEITSLMRRTAGAFFIEGVDAWPTERLSR